MSNLVFAGAGHVFPEVVRRLNMIRPARIPYNGETGPNIIHVSNWINADYFKDWIPYNLQATLTTSGPDVDTAAFGAFTTAPDGTTDTARLLRELPTDSVHGFVSHTTNLSQFRAGKLRFSGVFKYAGRRIVMALKFGNYAADVGCKAVFDLQSGTVAIANVFYGGVVEIPWVVYPAQITPVGNGWYLCSVSAQANCAMLGGVSGFGCKLMLDNGTAGAVERSTYIGDGLSGVYAWRSNLLPSRAWDLNNVTFFDDFDDDTMSNIDLNNTRTEGYNWYMRNPWPGWDAGTVTSTDASQNPDPGIGHGIIVDPDNFSCADSVLRIEHTPHKILNSAASTWDRPPTVGIIPDPEVPGDWPRNYTSGYVGRGWVPPYLLEWKFAWDPNISDQGQAFWGQPIEYQTIGRMEAHTQTVYGRELDYFEDWNGRAFNIHLWPPYHDDSYGSFHAQPAPAYWSNIWVYTELHGWNPGAHVEHLGTIYTCLALNGGEYGVHPPDTSPAYWGPYNNPASGVQPPVVDFRDMHTFEAMVFPYTADEPGQILLFFDGGLCSIPLVYGPDIDIGGVSTLFHLSDTHHEPLMIGANPDYWLEIDWVRVTQ